MLAKRRDWVFIALVGLLVQAFWASRLTHPSYFDAYYYTTNAQRIAEGAGLTENIIWQYLSAPAGIPTPSHTYWMPLTSLLAAPGYALFGTFRGAQIPFWLMAGLLPLLSYAISWQLKPDRRQAWVAALFTMAGGYYAAYWNQPSTFVVFAWTGGACLFALALAQKNARKRYWFIAGLLAGLSHLTRADGILLVAIAIWMVLLGIRERGAGNGEQSKGNQLPTTSYQRLSANGQPLLLVMAGYLVIMSGWFWRTWILSGRVLSTVGTQTIFITTYNDVFAYDRTFNLTDYLAWGWGNILQSKLEAASLAAQTFIGVSGLTAFVIFVIIAWIHLRRNRFLRPFAWYTLGLYLVMSLVFTFPGQRGSLLHSSTALWPWTMALASAGIGVGVDWIAARRPRWNPEQAKGFFGVTLVILVFFISLIVSGEQPLGGGDAAVYGEIKGLVPAGATIMIDSPPAFHYHTQLPAVVVPNEPPERLLLAAQAYNVDYLVLNGNRPPPLADLYEGKIELTELELIHELDQDMRLYKVHLTE